MPERWIRIRGGGRIRIDPGWGDMPLPGSSPPVAESTVAPVTVPGVYAKDSVALSEGLLEREEIRVESVFRPGVPDVEVLSLLTGTSRNAPDRFFGLSSKEVIKDATTDSVVPSLPGIIELLRRQHARPALIIELHTHPSGVARPSAVDKKHWPEATTSLVSAFPGARVLFGVHAVNVIGGDFVERDPPHRVSSNRIAWRSNTHEHELGLYTEKGVPVEVTVT